MKKGTAGRARLSVILLVDKQRERAEVCLRNILGQKLKGGIEILLLDFASSVEPPLRTARNPAVRTIKLNHSIGYGPARGLAVRMARASIVGFIEEHVAVCPGWAEAMLKAHRGDWAGVGPEVRNPTPGRGLSDIIYLTGFCAWVPPLEACESRLIPSHNSTFKREVLLRYGSELDLLLEADLFLQWRLRADGYKFFQTPEARIEHTSEGGLRTLMRGYYLFMRSFAPLRAERFRWSLARRGMRLALVPLAPFYRTSQVLYALARRRSVYFWRALADLWAVWVAHLAGAAGEAVGLLGGTSAHDQRFLIYEMNADRIRLKPNLR